MGCTKITNGRDSNLASPGPLVPPGLLHSQLPKSWPHLSSKNGCRVTISSITTGTLIVLAASAANVMLD